MADADKPAANPNSAAANASASPAAGRMPADPDDTSIFAAAFTEAANAPAKKPDAGKTRTSVDDDADEPAKAKVPAGPGKILLALRGLAGWIIHWHPLMFLGLALMLAAYAWWVYPEPESRQIPPAESFYYDGLDRLYRVINPDLPLVAASPADEALAARNSFLNLFVFYRDKLGDFPEFINPHLLLGEANRVLAVANPAMADKYWTDAEAAYNDAEVWEHREVPPQQLARYIDANFLGGRHRDNPATEEILSPDNDEVTLRRQRRDDYIKYRRAEAKVYLNRPELARPDLEDLRRLEDSRRREDVRSSVQGGMFQTDLPRQAFELGPDDYRDLDLLLAKAYDGLGLLDLAKGWYLRYLAAVPEGRNHAFVVGRLADISMQDGEVYRKANPAEAERAYLSAVNYYRNLLDSSSAAKADHDAAILGLGRANSRLAGLAQVGEPTGVDDLAAAGRTFKGWLEEFSGQPLPRRTLALPEAIGGTLAKPEMILPGIKVLPSVVGGTLSALAGGRLVTPGESRRRYLTEALHYFDRVAAVSRGTLTGDMAAVQAARESWNLGNNKDAEARLERLIDPLSQPETLLAARIGLARLALDRGDLRRADMLILGGYVHSAPLWFELQDADWRKIAIRLGDPANREEPGVWRRVWDSLSQEGRDIAGYAASGRRLDDDYVNRFLRAMNGILRRRDFYVPADFPPLNRNAYLNYLLGPPAELLTREDLVWRNRLLLEEAWPYDLSPKAGRNNLGYTAFPPGSELAAMPMVDVEELRGIIMELGRKWSRAAAAAPEPEERLRMLDESNRAFQAALDDYQGDPGEILYEMAHNYESLAEIREREGNHLEALSLTATAARAYLDVSLKARGSTREMDSLLAAGDAFFRSGLLERTVESQLRFLERYGHSAGSGSDSAMSVVRAENLLGRAYWFLGNIPEALRAFRRNIPRRTPDRYKSMYYIGRMLMDEGVTHEQPELLGGEASPLPRLDAIGDPQIDTALQAFNYLRQSPGINPSARAWRWATFDLGKLRYLFAEQARRRWEQEREREAAAGGTPAAGEGELRPPYVQLYEEARVNLVEALERYPLKRGQTAGGPGLSVRVEPEDYADTMASRFETEYLLANTLLAIGDATGDDGLNALARAHLENMRDRSRYAQALFDATLDRFQLNSAVIREEVEGGVWQPNSPLPRSRLGDDEGPTHSPVELRDILRNSMLLLANEYFKAGEKARESVSAAVAAAGPGPAAGTAASGASGAAQGYYQDSYRIWQDMYDRFGAPFGTQAMLNMGDCLNRLGFPADASNHYRMAVNIADLLPPETRSDGMLDIGPAFWKGMAERRLQDMADGYKVP